MPFEKIVSGYKSFYSGLFKKERRYFTDLAEKGQSPETLVIGCSDSRADPALITSSLPGDMFVVRNVAALVPPYKSDDNHHGTSAAIEFAVKGLKVKHIVVMGHSLCGGIMALADRKMAEQNFEFITPWMNIAEPARQKIASEMAHAPADQRQTALEKSVVLVSLRNLMTFPWVASRVNEGTLQLHGWYYDLKSGELMSYDPKADSFAPLKAA